MQGPLKTIIRNKTDKPLIYPVFPRIYVQPMGETVLDFDPFTRWKETNGLEPLLVDVRLERAQIVYSVDPRYATAAAGTQCVVLSMNAELKASGGVKKPVEKPVEKVKHPQQPERTGVPFGKLPEDVAEPAPKTGAITDGKSTHPTAALNAEVIKKVADTKPDTVVDLSKDASKNAAEAVTLTPINDAEIEQKTATAASETSTVSAKPRKSRKKEVARL